MIDIAFLVDCPEVIPTLTQWFRAQWPGYYGERTQADIAQDFHFEANRTRIPMRLIAFFDGELAGTITLREHALQEVPESHPGLGGLFVVEAHRGQGIGTALVKAGMNVAKEHGYKQVYVSTVTARGILARLGWTVVQPVSLGDEQTMLYRYDL